jgi:hypothetical protein
MPTRPAVPSKTSELGIFGRLIKADDGDLAPEFARYLLTLGFEEPDQARMLELAERNQSESLVAEDREELDSYVKAGHLLAMLQSKARKSLRREKAS